VVVEEPWFNHTISAPNQTIGGNTYTFASWSDGGAQTHTIVVPETAQTYTANFNAVAGDMTPPTVALTAPPAGTVSGTVAVAANASDNVGVAGVQFLVDNTALGAEDTAAPYSVSWNTTTATNGSHTLTALARDAAGNTTTSAAVPVTVANATTAPPAFVQVKAATPQTNQSSVAVTYTGAQAAGDTNIVVVGWNNTTSSVSSVTDTAGNAYQVAVSTARGNGVSQAIYYAPNIKAAAAGTNTVTTTLNTATPFVDVRALEYSGLGPFDVGTSASGTGASANSGTVTTTRLQRADLRGRHHHRWFLGGGNKLHHPHHHPRRRHRRRPDCHRGRPIQCHRTRQRGLGHAGRHLQTRGGIDGVGATAAARPASRHRPTFGMLYRP
jgi:hypothetical protein